jgi:hypothetical protein
VPPPSLSPSPSFTDDAKIEKCPPPKIPFSSSSPTFLRYTDRVPTNLLLLTLPSISVPHVSRFTPLSTAFHMFLKSFEFDNVGWFDVPHIPPITDTSSHIVIVVLFVL